MNKVIICLVGGCLLLAMQALHAGSHAGIWLQRGSQIGDTLRQTGNTDTARQTHDSSMHVRDSIRLSDGSFRIQDALPVGDSTPPVANVADSVPKQKDIVVDAGKLSDTTAQQADGKVKDADDKVKDADGKVKDADSKVQDADGKVKDPGNTLPVKDSAKQAQDSASKEEGSGKRELDTRWFISPLLKFQFQDFAMLEKNRKGYLSDANTLPFFNRGNASFAASAYKNITSRLSISADIGLSFGHVTNDDVLISQTQSKTFNLLGAALYYHLLGPSYGLQPYITVGINDIINDESYVSAPVGIGAKYNGRKIMVMGQFTYGCAVGKNVSNTTMYTMGVYLPIKNKKKKKQSEADDNSPYNRPGKDKDDAKKKDSTAKNNGGVVNNIYITINMDSVFKSRGYRNDDDNDNGNGSSGGRRRKRSGGGNGNDEVDDVADREAFKSFDLDDFATNDFKIDRIDGHPVIRFVVYFEFNEYSLNSKAFNSIDKVLAHLKRVTNMYIEIKGYTDDVGTDQYNNFLSRRRANMVRDYINSRGVPVELMKAKAYGSDNPVADNSDPNSAWLNRRAEIIVRIK
jgi:outer membrane protein OmpA-like peptidoglycan-associated protein